MDRETAPTTVHPAAAPQDAGPAPRWTWRGTLAGALAGGLLVAGVTVPVTWAALRDGDAGRATQQTTEAAGLDDLPEPPTSEWLGPSTSTGTDAATATAATDAQSHGVVLIDTTLTDGAAAGTGPVVDASGPWSSTRAAWC